MRGRTLSRILYQEIVAFKNSTGTYQGDCGLEKESNQSLGGLFHADSELTLIPGDPECHCSMPARVEPYRGRWLTDFSLGCSCSWSSGTPNLFCGYCPCSEVEVYDNIL